RGRLSNGPRCLESYRDPSPEVGIPSAWCHTPLMINVPLHNTPLAVVTQEALTRPERYSISAFALCGALASFLGPQARQSPYWALRTRLTSDNAVYINQTGGYCWSMSQCQKLCFACAFAEGLKISRIQCSHSSHVAWKEDGQQYPSVFLLLGR